MMRVSTCAHALVFIFVLRRSTQRYVLICGRMIDRCYNDYDLKDLSHRRDRTSLDHPFALYSSTPFSRFHSHLHAYAYTGIRGHARIFLRIFSFLSWFTTELSRKSMDTVLTVSSPSSLEILTRYVEFKNKRDLVFFLRSNSSVSGTRIDSFLCCTQSTCVPERMRNEDKS